MSHHRLLIQCPIAWLRKGRKRELVLCQRSTQERYAKVLFLHTTLVLFRAVSVNTIKGRGRGPSLVYSTVHMRGLRSPPPSVQWKESGEKGTQLAFRLSSATVGSEHVHGNISIGRRAARAEDGRMARNTQQVSLGKESYNLASQTPIPHMGTTFFVEGVKNFFHVYMGKQEQTLFKDLRH